MKIKVTSRKWNGDDAYSWAVFRSDQDYPVVSGLHRTEVNSYKKQVLEMVEKDETSAPKIL